MYVRRTGGKQNFTILTEIFAGTSQPALKSEHNKIPDIIRDLFCILNSD